MKSFILLVPLAASMLFSGVSHAQFQEEIVTYTKATMPTTGPPGHIIQISDDVAVGECGTVGGGTKYSLCAYDVNGTALVSVAGIGAGASGHPVSDALAVIKGSTDPTAEVRIEVDGITGPATRVWTAPDEDVAIHDSQTDHEERYGIFNVLDYGAIAGDGIDDTDEIKAAWVACASSSSAGAGVLKFQRGIYDLSDTLPADGRGIDLTTEGNIGGCDFIGVSPTNTGTTFRWTGTDGVGQAIHWDGSISAEFTSFRGLQFRYQTGGGWNYPGVWIYAKGLDKYSIIEFVRFSGEIGVQIDGYVNVQWSQIRCDGTKWCIDIAQAAYVRNVSIENFTMDVSGSASHNWDGTLHGFMRLGCTSCSSLNLGSIAITNGRSESNSNDYQDGFRFFEFDQDSAPGATVDLFVSGVAAQHGDATGSVTSGQPCMFGLTHSAPTAFTRYQVTSVNGAYDIEDQFCGDWGSSWAVSGADGASESGRFQMTGAGMIYTGNNNIHSRAPANSPTFSAYNTADTESADISGTKFPTISIQGDGDILFSSDPGIGDLDIQIGPTGAGELGMPAGDSFCFNAGTECIRYNSVKACLYYDENDNDKCENGEELSANCATACDGVE